MGEIRVLEPGDEALADAFLARHADSSMNLRSDIRRAGLVDRGAPFEGTYAAVLEDGAITALAGHAWNGRILLQAPRSAAGLLDYLVPLSGRTVSGFTGPLDQVEKAGAWAGTSGARPSFKRRTLLMTLDLDHLDPPGAFKRGLVCRAPDESELDFVVAWRVAFVAGLIGSPETDDMRRSERIIAEILHKDGHHWLLTDHGHPVAYAGFNAVLPDAVQLAWVYTPPEHRGRGYGRGVVAGALMRAHADGVARGVLAVEDDNEPAIRAYRALGFREVGLYGYLLFEF